VRNYRCGIFLKIIRRQPIVFRADEGFEETPGPASDQPANRYPQSPGVYVPTSALY